VQVTGPGEIGLLANTMEAMRQELKSSRDELLQWAELLEQRVAQRTNELDALNQVSSEIASRLELRQVLNSVVAKTGQLLAAEVVFLCLLDESGQQMCLHATLGPAEAVSVTGTPAIAPLTSQILTADLPLSCGADDCRGACMIIKPDYRKSHLAAPLKTGERIIGALCVGSSKNQKFGPDAPALLNRLANIAAIAIQNARLYEQVERAASLEERQCIAAEMHDGLAQTLSFLQLVADQTRLQVEAGQSGQALQNLDRIHRGLDRAVVDTRRAIASLQEEGPLQSDLQDQLATLVQEFLTQCALPVVWQSALSGPLTISRHDSEQVLRVVREGLLNASRHSRASQVVLRLELDEGQAAITIQDNGQGFDPDETQAENGRSHFGLKIMRARAARIGGRVGIVSTPGVGTQVKLTWPVE
jgi:two-component system nitrate/nitrite sensor histidine kinase NarX